MLLQLYITLATIPPMAMAAVIVLVYLMFAARRWRWPMLADAGLLFLYLWRPSIFMLLFCFWLGAVRYFRPWSREFVLMFSLDEHVGLTDSVIRFLLPAAFSPTAPTHVGDNNMSSPATRQDESHGMNPVYIPVSRYDMTESGMNEPTPVSPDIDQQSASAVPPHGQLDRISTIAVLAVQKTAGKYTYSANKIAELVGGDRNKTLDTIRELRSGPAAPIFPPRTEAQTQARADLRLDES